MYCVCALLTVYDMSEWILLYLKHSWFPVCVEVICTRAQQMLGWPTLAKLTHHVWKKGATVLLSLTAKCWPIFKILSQSDLAVISNKAVMKYPTTSQMHHYATLWNVSVQKSQWARVEWSKHPCKIVPFKTVKNIHPLMLAALTERYLQ